MEDSGSLDHVYFFVNHSTTSKFSTPNDTSGESAAPSNSPSATDSLDYYLSRFSTFSPSELTEYVQAVEAAAQTASILDNARSSYEDDMATVKKLQCDIDQTRRTLEKLQQKLSADMGLPSQHIFGADRSAVAQWYKTKKEIFVK